MMVPSIESRLDMNESVFMREPIAPQLFKSNQSACRDYLSVHGIYYRRIEAYNSLKVITHNLLKFNQILNHFGLITTKSTLPYT